MSAGPTRVLVVDDEPKICQFLETLLRRDGHEVTTTLSGEEGLRRLRSGTYSLVITDLKMPGMDGFELISHIHELDDEIPIVVITGYATVETAVQALRHGVHDYITKPFNIHDLKHVVDRVLGQARLAYENRSLVERLAKLEAELQYHRGLLQSRSRLADDELRDVNTGLRRRVRELVTVGDFEGAAGSMLTATAVAEACADTVIRRVGARRCSVMLRRQATLVVEACDESRRDDILGARQNIGSGISGTVARDDEAVLVTDIEGHPAFGPMAQGGYETSCFMSVPIRHEHTFYGVLNAADRNSGDAFTSADLETLCSVAGRLGAALARTDKVNAIQHGALAALAQVTASLEDKDPFMRGHSRLFAAYARALAGELGLPAADRAGLVYAARVHDLTKYGISDAILHKKSALTTPEYALVQDHPATAQRLLEACRAPADTAAAVRHHHERADGKGYPDRLKLSRIPLLARILSVVDAFDSMTASRPYREGLDARRAREEIRTHSGSQFDPEIAEVFCKQVASRPIDETDLSESWPGVGPDPE